jgi:hypothetical protein
VIRLDTDTRKLEALLAGAVATTQPSVYVSYRDRENSLDATKEIAEQLTAVMTGATPITVCDAPGKNVCREIDTIAARNNDTAVVTLTLRVNDNGTTYQLVKFTLQVGDHLEYTDMAGWQVIDVNGNLRE